MIAVDLTGQRFERLEVLELAHKSEWRGHRKWVCLCDCGTVVRVSVDKLRSGHTRSCGCLQREVTAAANGVLQRGKKHGHTKFGGECSPTYHSWQAMKGRCCNPAATGYKYYGARGVTVCDSWLTSFEQFLADMGERPRGTSLDRIDPYGNYEPSNCRWASRAVQSANQRRYQ